MGCHTLNCPERSGDPPVPLRNSGRHDKDKHISPAAPMIEARGLVKHYRATRAVDGLSFQVKPLPHTLSPAATFGLLCAYPIATLLAGAWVLGRRDA